MTKELGGQFLVLLSQIIYFYFFPHFFLTTLKEKKFHAYLNFRKKRLSDSESCQCARFEPALRSCAHHVHQLTNYDSQTLLTIWDFSMNLSRNQESQIFIKIHVRSYIVYIHRPRSLLFSRNLCNMYTQPLLGSLILHDLQMLYFKF